MIELDRRFGGVGVEYQRGTQWAGAFGRLLLGVDVIIKVMSAVVARIWTVLQVTCALINASA